MIKQDVKIKKTGATITVSTWAAEEMVKKDVGYIVSEPYEFPKEDTVPFPKKKKKSMEDEY